MKFRIRCYPSAKHAVSATVQNKIYESEDIGTIQPGDILSIADILEPQGFLIVEDKEYVMDVEGGGLSLTIAVGLYASLDEYRATVLSTALSFVPQATLKSIFQK